MSVPPASHSLAEVLIQRTFVRPPRALVDAELIAALTDEDRAAAAQPATPAGGDAPQVDVRA